jgi:2-polyprenyl-6-methoxyphenol hydroxylase-like FAD-dependent oxidoreductase
MPRPAGERSLSSMNEMSTGRPGTRPDCQVLIVGAGPTGLVLAAELLARGVATRIIDKGDGFALESRALALHARTLEVLDLMGVAERFIDVGQIVRRFTFYSEGRRLLTLKLANNGSRYGFMLNLSQDDTERLLRRRVGELGGAIEYGVELESLQADPAGATAKVRDRDGCTSLISADFVVGCDGAHSRVRHELGLEFRGHPYPQEWLLADVRLGWSRPEDEAHAFFRADPAPLIFFPMRAHRWRMTIPFAGPRDGSPPTLEEMQRLTDERAPERVVLSDPTWLATFRCHRRSASVCRRGRVLLAGDAVHIHTPAGGQGMNTGMTDAHNLAWKLALVASGRAPESLLDSYGEERDPVAAGVLRLTHTLVGLGTLDHPIKRAARDAIVPAALGIPAVQRRAARRWTQVHVSYQASSLTRPDRYPGRPRPGDRVQDTEVLSEDGRATLYQVLRRGRHVAAVPPAHRAGQAGQDSAAIRARLAPHRDLVEVVTGSLSTSRWPRGGRAALVCLIRPDGHVAARCRPANLAPVLDYLDTLSGTTRHLVTA